ncbi:carboxypeptidase-like regulatory domain-containing protein [Bordetella genomosp. 9]|uniref:Carboxypeptidase regulatory-like domain-containing protein n=1 Tax=Bordetella genomosp. 9 TaxID=1416803 RepID=A0A1W6Z1N1_9BORD|nr:carboxypeptidase-like regulatory domain-containing protein [Bordetella genomosp. 9]ARP87009.1 hypothetical protein CAL13_12895 [Bordetella genomosp. 9]ARP90994.1 hypothetical protein CAL14_12415 [Bordetella genomosp. 9]
MKTLRFDRTKMTALAALLVLGAAMAPAYADLPPVQTQGNVQYVTGGVGLDESTAMKAAEKDYPLTLVFAQKQGDQNVYTADVPVTITDNKGATVLQATTNGPYMLVKLPPGQYTIRSTYNGTEKVQRATVAPGSHARSVFEWQ